MSRNRPWIEDARCTGADPMLWFPESGGHHNPNTEAAINICNACPVRTPCLEYAMRIERITPGRYGVYGGLTADERAALDRRSA